MTFASIGARLEATTQLAPVHSIDATAVLGLALYIAPSGLVALPGTVAVHEMKIHSWLLGAVCTGYIRGLQAGQGAMHWLFTSQTSPTRHSSKLLQKKHT